MTFEQDDLVKEFLIESLENLERLDQEFVLLEKQPNDLKLLGSIFRTVHTVKGSCGFFGYNKLQQVTHVGENLLGLLRDGKLSVTPEISTTLLQLVDAIREMLGHIESTGTEGTTDYSFLTQQMDDLICENTTSKNHSTNKQDKQVIATIAGNQSAEKKSAQTISLQPKQQEENQSTHAERALTIPISAEKKDVAEATTGSNVLKEIDKFEDQEQTENRPHLADQSIRVDVGLLDKLMNLVGELVLARNQILQSAITLKDPNYLNTTQRLNLITTELQEGVMKTRMQQIGTIWNRFPRLVRDVAVQCGKKVRLEMFGNETELDRTLIESIRDPLTHILRNSVDHGIENSDKRKAKGKNPEGVITIKAFHEGGQVNIEISDDGGGIDAEKVLAKAIEKGLVKREESNRMTQSDLINLIFLPGFSTAEKITNVSGRGVGMDVVKTNIEKIGGIVDLQSELGMGTTIRIKIPLTLAIIPALIVTSSGDRFAIPQISLLELVRLEGENARKGIELVQNVPVYRLRGNLLPLVDLNQILSISSELLDNKRDQVNIVVLQAEGHPFGLVVDSVNDTEEIVVKPLSKVLKNIPLFAGATIMGDGKVALILDVMGLAHRSFLTGQGRESRHSDRIKKSTEGNNNLKQMMIMKLGKRRIAIPLALVSRLEEIPVQNIEVAGGKEVIQYRDEILPLIRLNHILGEVSIEEVDNNDKIQIVVYEEKSKKIGLVVDQILEIIETEIRMQAINQQVGIIGSAVIWDRVTDLLDVQSVIRSYDPEFHSAKL